LVGALAKAPISFTKNSFGNFTLQKKTLGIELDNPQGICFDDTGLLIVAVKNENIVKSITATDKLKDFAKGELKFPTCVAICPISSNVAVVDKDEVRVQVFDPDTQQIKMQCANFKNISDIVFDGDGDLFVCDCDGNKISVFTHGESKPVLEYEIDQPSGICIFRDKIMVVSQKNCIVQLTKAGMREGKKKLPQFGNKILYDCGRLAVDIEGNVVAAETAENKKSLKIFDKNWNYLGPVTLDIDPTFITVSPDGKIVVSSKDCNKLIIYSSNQ